MVKFIIAKQSFKKQKKKNGSLDFQFHNYYLHMLKSALVLGPSGIGKAHLRVLANFGVKNIYVKGKNFKSNRLDFLGLNKNSKTNFHNLKSLNKLKKKVQVSSICTPVEKHLSHLLHLKKICNRIIVEKPFIWNFKKNNYKISKNILNKKSSHKIFINLPMVSLADQLVKKEKIKKINDFKFNYFTAGKQNYNNIAIDLLPHAISFLLTINKKYKKIKIIKIINKKNSWRCDIIIDKCNCHFNFIQNKNKKSSQLSFQINKNFYIRKQIKKGDNYQVSLIKNASKKIKLSNPLQEYLLLILKNIDNKSFQKKNNEIALNTVKFTQIIIMKNLK